MRIEVLLYGSIVLASAYLGVSEFRTTARFADLLDMNSNLTREDSTNRAVIDGLAADGDDVVGTGVCRSDIVRAGLAFVMKDIELQDPTNGYDQWASAVGRANRYVLHALSCNPADGDMWARLALVSQAVGENPRQLADFMDESVLLSPAEMHTIRARFVVWKRATAATLSAAQHSVGRDLSTLLNYADPNDIADILGTPNSDRRSYSLVAHSSELNSYVIAAADFLPEARKTFLNAKGIRLPDGP